MTRLAVSSAALLLLAISAIAAGPSPAPTAVNRAELAERVRAEFLYSWRAYEQYAWATTSSGR